MIVGVMTEEEQRFGKRKRRYSSWLKFGGLCGIVALCMAPMWFLADDRDSDEVIKSITAMGLIVLGGAKLIVDLLKDR